MKIVKSYAIAIVSVALFIFCIANQSMIAQAVRSGIDKSVYLLIPSLFPSMVLSSVISKSGIIRCIARYLPVEADAFEVFVLGNIGGYPTGAKLVCEKISRGELDKETAAKMLKYAYNSGPAFCIGVVGLGLFGSATIGLAIYLTEFAVNLTLFIISQLKVRKVKRLYTMYDVNTAQITESVMSSFNASLTITAFVMIFAAINAILSGIFDTGKYKYFTAIIDITTISDLSSTTFSVACLLVCFGGLCVITQVSAITSGILSLIDYAVSFAYKLPLCYAYSNIALIILDKAGVSVSATKASFSQNKSIVPFICVIIMVIISILEYKKLLSK